WLMRPEESLKCRSTIHTRCRSPRTLLLDLPSAQSTCGTSDIEVLTRALVCRALVSAPRLFSRLHVRPRAEEFVLALPSLKKIHWPRRQLCSDRDQLLRLYPCSALSDAQYFREG